MSRLATLCALFTLAAGSTNSLRAGLSMPSLSRLAAAAISTGRPIELAGRTLSLAAEVRLPPGSTLAIRGPGAIVGDGHSLFRVSGGASMLLSLDGVDLVHCASAARAQRHELGAAVFALGKARVQLHNCTVSSEAGFGIWMVQRSRVSASGCRIRDCGRSAVVSFNDARLRMSGCELSDAAQHGVCARGDSRVELRGCRVLRAGVRGIYAYHNASLVLRGVEVSGTRDASAAAVQIEALRPEDRASLTMDAECRLTGNAGEDLRVAGAVVCDLPEEWAHVAAPSARAASVAARLADVQAVRVARGLHVGGEHVGGEGSARDRAADPGGNLPLSGAVG